MKTIIIVFVVALLVRLLALAYFLPKLNSDVDLDSYRSLGRSLAAGQGFVAPSPDCRVSPNVARTPVYPLFLAGLIGLGGDRVGWFLFAQCLLGAATSALTVLLARRWLSPTATAVAGLLVALDPNSILRCVDLRTETLFTLLLVLGLLAGWSGHRRLWFAAGAAWALAALCRPIAVWLWVIIVVLVIARKLQPVYLLAFLAGYIPVEGIWVARNAALTGRPFISTMATYNLLMYRAAAIEAERTTTTLDAVQTRWREDFGDLQWFHGRRIFEEQLQRYRTVAARILRTHATTAIRHTAAGWAKVLFGPGARSLDNSLREPGTPARWWALFYTVALVVLAVLAMAGAWRLGWPAALLSGLVLYFVVLAGGPEANSRFRTPITPVLAVLAVAGIRRKQ